MISPHFHTSNFDVDEFNPYPVDIAWSLSEGQQSKSKTLFPVGANFPSVKSMTFDNRLEPMDLGVSYS